MEFRRHSVLKLTEPCDLRAKFVEVVRSDASETGKSSTEQVARTFTLSGDQQGLRQLERLGVATDSREEQLSACYIVEGWDTVPELMRLAREATGTVEEADEARWQQRRPKLARRLLAALSGGWLTEQQIYYLARKEALGRGSATRKSEPGGESPEPSVRVFAEGYYAAESPVAASGRSSCRQQAT